MKRFPCNICGKIFGRKSNLYQHFRNIHRLDPLVDAGKLLCPFENCKAHFFSYEKLRAHLNNIHGVKIRCKKLNFSDKNEFVIWKDNLKKNDGSSYIIHGAKVLKGGCKKTYFKCHRSGKNVLNPFMSSRKAHNTCKMGADCPSTMEVIELSDGGVEVYFYGVHVGHKLESKQLILSETEEIELEIVAENVAENIPFQRIIDDISNGIGSENFHENDEMSKNDASSCDKDLLSLRNKLLFCLDSINKNNLESADIQKANEHIDAVVDLLSANQKGQNKFEPAIIKIYPLSF